MTGKCIDLGIVERVRAIRQNHHAGFDYEFGTPEERAAHNKAEAVAYFANLERVKGRHWL